MKNEQPFILLYIFLLAIFACTTKTTERETLSVVADSVSIPITEGQLSFYYTLAHDPVNNRFFGYNHTTHALDIFDLGQGTFLKSIRLEREGPNMATNITSFQPFEDHIWLNALYFFIKIDMDGQVLERLKKDTFNGFDIGAYDMEAKLSMGGKLFLAYHPATHQVVLPLFSLKNTFEERSFEDIPNFAIYDLKNQQIALSPVGYPSIMQENNFGYIFDCYFKWVNGQLYYLYANHATLYRFDPETGEHTAKSLPGSPIGETSEILPQKPNSKAELDHFFNANRFLSLDWLPGLALWTVTGKGKTDSDRAHDRSNNHLLLVRQQDLTVAYSSKLPPNVDAVPCIHQNALYFQMKGNASEGHLKFYKLTVAE